MREGERSKGRWKEKRWDQATLTCRESCKFVCINHGIGVMDDRSTLQIYGKMVEQLLHQNCHAGMLDLVSGKTTREFEEGRTLGLETSYQGHVQLQKGKRRF